MTTRRLVLASSSPYRRELLERLGIPFDAASPGVDEDAYKARIPAASDLVVALAEAKARALADRYPDALVIGSDQCAELDGRVLGKPGTVDGARAQLAAMRGRTHDLWTGVAVLDTADGSIATHLDRHRLTMRDLPDDAIARYVDVDRPVDCAGSYKIEALGIALFDRIEGEDFTAIVGLPLTAVARLLDRLGVAVP